MASRYATANVSIDTVGHSASEALAPLQAVALYEALSTLIDVADGLLCQPRFHHGGVLNAAGEILSLMRDDLGDRAEAAMASAASAAPIGHHQRMGWAEAILRHRARGADSVEELVTFAQSLAQLRS